jgi:tyrosyl-tRNA synthetase
VIAAEEAAEGVPVYRLFVLAKLAASNAEARRLVRGGGARVDDEAIADETMLVTRERLEAGVKLSAGRKQHRLAKIEG